MTGVEAVPNVALREAECWALLRRAGKGVVATAADSKADLFPVNYLIDGETLLFRSAPGTKLDQIAAAPDVAFIIEGHGTDGYWSVVMRGTAELLSDQVEIIGSGALELAPWAAGEKRNFVRVTPQTISGRRVSRADFGRSNLFG